MGCAGISRRGEAVLRAHRRRARGRRPLRSRDPLRRAHAAAVRESTGMGKRCPMRVLITNTLLDRGGGTQTDVRDLAVWLHARGHSPFVYSPVLGDGAAQLRRHTIPVTEDLSTVG